MLRTSARAGARRAAPLVLAALLAGPAARAQVPALQSAFQISGGFEQQAQFFQNPDGSMTQSFDLGYTFTVSSPVVVTALGFYDDGTGAGGTSLTGSHAVGLFDDATQQLLVQGTVSSADPFSDLFRYTSALSGPAGLPLVGLNLLPGATYEAVAVTGDDPFDVVGPDFAIPASPGVPANPSSFAQAPQVTFGQDRTFADPATGSNDQSALTYAGQTNGSDFGLGTGSMDYGYFGPNFLFTAAPEPSQFAGLAFGALGLGGLMLRARKRQ